jgi:hypothetical protein
LTVSGLVGTGNHIHLAGVEAQWPSNLCGTCTDDWSWSLNWAADVAYLWASNHLASSPSLWETGFTPVSGLAYYLEGGIGVHLLSHTYIDNRGVSTAFQFGEFVGTGVNFRDRGQYGVGARIQHCSKGGIKEPNCGVALGEVRISYRWD